MRYFLFGVIQPFAILAAIICVVLGFISELAGNLCDYLRDIQTNLLRKQ